MTFYQTRILPYLVHVSMRQDVLARYRKRLVAGAEGQVLELGVGSGLNLQFFGERVTQVVGLDPSPKLLAMARKAPRGIRPFVEFIQGSGEGIPLDRNSIDTVVTSWTLCSIPDVPRALSEVRRVLRPSGRLLFVEHGRSPDANVTRWQDRLTPVWKRIAGGCHLNRSIDTVINTSGFRVERLDTGYMKGPKLLTFMYEGSARPI